MTTPATIESNKARDALRRMPQTRDTVLRLLLMEAGLGFEVCDGPDCTARLIKIANVPANLGRTPEEALTRVIAKHLHLE